MSLWPRLAATPFHLSYLDADGVRTRYLEAGEGDQYVLFLHGVGGHLESFAKNIAAHAAEHHAIAVDLLGHGYSGPSRGGYEIDDYIKHLVAFMDAKGIVCASLVGTSLGAWIAGRMAARFPARVRTVTLAAAGGLVADPKVMESIRSLTLNAVRGATMADVRARLDWVIHNKSMITDDLVETRYQIYSRPGYTETMSKIMCLQDLETRKRNLLTRAELASIIAPTLVAWTANDPTADLETGRRLANDIPNARFVVFDNSGHMPQLEEPDLFNRIHLEFLRNATQGAPRSDAASPVLPQR